MLYQVDLKRKIKMRKTGKPIIFAIFNDRVFGNALTKSLKLRTMDDYYIYKKSDKKVSTLPNNFLDLCADNISVFTIPSNLTENNDDIAYNLKYSADLFSEYPFKALKAAYNKVPKNSVLIVNNIHSSVIIDYMISNNWNYITIKVTDTNFKINTCESEFDEFPFDYIVQLNNI